MLPWNINKLEKKTKIDIPYQNLLMAEVGEKSYSISFKGILTWFQGSKGTTTSLTNILNNLDLPLAILLNRAVLQGRSGQYWDYAVSSPAMMHALITP